MICLRYLIYLHILLIVSQQRCGMKPLPNPLPNAKGEKREKKEKENKTNETLKEMKKREKKKKTKH